MRSIGRLAVLLVTLCASLLNRVADRCFQGLNALLKSPPIPRYLKMEGNCIRRTARMSVLRGNRRGSALASALCAGMTLALMATLVIGGTIVMSTAVPEGAYALAISPVLVAKNTELDTKRKALAEVFEAAGTNLDFSNKDVLAKLGAKDSVEAVEKVRAMNTEIERIYDEAKTLADLDRISVSIQVSGDALNQPGVIQHADPTRQKAQGLGDMIVASDAFKSYAKTKNPTSGEIKGVGMPEIRATLFQTSAGWGPESLRTGRVVDAVTRPIQVLDIIPFGETSFTTVKHMEETTRTHAAVEKAEGAAYPESTFVVTEKSSDVRKIGDSIPVTDEQLEDVPMVASYLNRRLLFGCLQRADGQVLVGDGNAPNLRGIVNVVGIQTQAKGADPALDAIHKAMTLVRVTGRAQPDFVVIHPTAWEAIRLLRTADGIYIWGHPSDVGVPRIWGAPAVLAEAQGAATAIVGDFGNFCMAFEKRGLDVQVGYVGSQFTEGKKTIRADFRLAFVVFRPAAFCTVTGL